MWTANEFKYMSFSDMRLVKRLGRIVQIFTNQPAVSIPKACRSRAEAKSIYRFFGNDRVSADSIRLGFCKSTMERIEEHPVVLYLSDATNLVYSSHKKLKGIGVLRNFKARGLSLHTTFVVTPDKLPLGIVSQMCWGRKEEDYGKRSERSKKPIEQKESYRWLQAFRAAQESLSANTQGIFIGDRGADVYELFAEPRKSNMELLIRAAHDRRTCDGTTKIFQNLSTSCPVGTMPVAIERANGRKARLASVELRFKNITLTPPSYKKNVGLSAVNITIISAIETGNNISETDKIHWHLITTLPIKSLEDAIQAVKTYAIRWMIERYHYVLKQGCLVEDLQLEEAERIDKAVIVYSMVAWKIMFLTYLARVQPAQPCTTVLANDEWKALCCYVNKTNVSPTQPPTIYQVVRMIAQMGGFLGRKSDGEPGVKTIWRGLQDLDKVVRAYRIFITQPSNICG